MRSSRLLVAGAAALAAMAGISTAVETAPEPPKPKRKTKTKKRKTARLLSRDYANPYSRSIYVPGGAERNCGDRGISPKLLERRHG